MPRKYNKKKKFVRRARIRRSPTFKMMLDQHVFKLKYDVADLTSDGSGNVSLAINANNFSGATDYTAITGMFDQYKVLSCSFRYFPIRTSSNALATLDIAPMYLCNDYDDLTAPTTTSEVIQYDNLRVKSVNHPFNHKMKFSAKASNDALNRAGWNDLSTANNVGSIKIFCEGLDASTTYGKYIIEFVIVVRGRR